MRSSRLLWALLMLALLLSAATAKAENARIEGVSSARNNHVLSVSFRVTNAFTPEMEQAIYSGIPHTFTYFVEIYRQIPAWPDLRVNHWQVKRTIHYDTLKKTFTVKFGQNEPAKQTTDFEQAKEWMTKFDGYPVAVETQLDRNFRHHVRIMAKLDPMNWPLFLDKILFFINVNEFETQWQRIDLPLELINNNAQ